jgi:hypothetical protein
MICRRVGGVLVQGSWLACSSKPNLLPKIAASCHCLHTTHKMSKFSLASKYQGLEKNVWQVSLLILFRTKEINKLVVNWYTTSHL